MKVAGNADGARIDLDPVMSNILDQQFEIGNIKDGDQCYWKIASDGTNLVKRETATVTTLTFANQTKALQIATIAVVMTSETYEVS